MKIDSPLRKSKISDILNSKKRTGVNSIPESTSIADVAKKMKREGIGFLVVTSEKEVPGNIGCVSERDIVFKAVADGLDLTKTPAERIMTKDVVTAKADQSIIDALTQFREHRFRPFRFYQKIISRFGFSHRLAFLRGY